MSDERLCQPAFSARAPVSYQFRMREPGTSLSPSLLTQPPGRRRRRRLGPCRCLACPCQKTQVLKREEPWVRVGKRGGGGGAIRSATAASTPLVPLPQTLARTTPSRTLGFNSSSRPAPSQVLRWQNPGTTASRSLVTLFRLIASRLTRANTVDGSEMNAKIP